MKKVLMIGPARNVKGGMTTVVNDFLDAFCDKKNISIKYLETINDKNIFLKFIKEKSGLIYFRFIISSYDILHVHMASRRSTFRKLKYIRIAKEKNKKVVLHMHGGGFIKFYREELDKNQKKYINKMLKKVDKIITLTLEMKKFLENELKIESKKIEIISNGVKIPKKHIRKSENIDPSIVFLGRIVENKGIFDVIPLISKIKTLEPNVKLHICGSGEEKKLLNIIKKYDVNDNVVMHGWVDNSSKEKIFKNCSFFILTSYFEAMPMSLLESMSYGLIPFVSNVGSISEIVKNDYNGKIYNLKDIDKIPYDFINIYKNFENLHRLSENAYKTVCENYNLEKNVSNVIRIYDEL